MLADAKENLRVLHPLPALPRSIRMWTTILKPTTSIRARNGLYARQAIICRALGIENA